MTDTAPPAGYGNGPTALLAATGFALSEIGTLSLGGAWGHEATIFVHLDDYLVRLRVAGAAGTAASV